LEVNPSEKRDDGSLRGTGEGSAALISGAPVDANQLSFETVQHFELFMHPGRQHFEIRIVSAHDDAGVIRIFAMETDKVVTIVGNHGPFVLNRKTEHFLVGDAVMGFSFIKGGADVVS
jgi:hypothetical protein